MRQFGTSRDGHAASFEAVNHSKRSIAVNLKDPAGAQVARRLIAAADVLVENFRPGVAARLGLDYAACRRLRPEIICVSISGYGAQGPYGGLPAFDTVVQAHAGIAYGQGGDAEPQFVRQAIVDKVTALYAAQAIAAALFARASGRGGDHINLSMYDAALAFLWPDGMNEHTYLDGDIRHAPPPGSLYSVQKTKDGYIAVSPITNEQFWGLCRAVGREEMVGDPRIDSLAKRMEERRLVGGIRAGAAEFTTQEICRRLLAEDVPHAPALPRAAVLADEQFRYAAVEEYGGPGRRTRMVIAPARSATRPLHPPTPAPRAGENSLQILEELGVTRAEAEDLVAGGAISQATFKEPA
jgi:crotonobetainyl-CoA:carnitine CoA-transferase CaiB-like acyl-CoA transferase